MPERKTNISTDQKGSSVVLFQRTGGSGVSGDMWDDSELIAAWNRQLDRKTALEADPVPLIPRTDGSSSDDNDDDDEEEEDEISEDERHSAQLETGVLPPMPQGVNTRVQTMLRAWFEAGLQTGLFLAEKQENRKNRKRGRD
jgi:hypothetical protein